MKKDFLSSCPCDSVSYTESELLTAKVSAQRICKAGPVDNNSTASVSFYEHSTINKEDRFREWVEINTDYPYMYHMGLSITIEGEFVCITFDPNPEANDRRLSYGYEVVFLYNSYEIFFHISANYGISIYEIELFKKISDNRDEIFEYITCKKELQRANNKRHLRIKH